MRESTIWAVLFGWAFGVMAGAALSGCGVEANPALDDGAGATWSFEACEGDDCPERGGELHGDLGEVEADAGAEAPDAAQAAVGGDAAVEVLDEADAGGLGDDGATEGETEGALEGDAGPEEAPAWMVRGVCASPYGSFFPWQVEACAGRAVGALCDPPAGGWSEPAPSRCMPSFEVCEDDPSTPVDECFGCSRCEG